jgi:hypothetical protein
VQRAADCTDAAELTRAELETRLGVYEDFARKCGEYPALADGQVVETPPLVGIRQSRVIEGDYRLTAEDVLEGRRFPDGIAVCVNCILHYYGYRRYLEHDGYDIPFRALLPRGVENLIVAGRCISGDQAAFESFRGMVVAMATGQAAGTAAALASGRGVTPRRLDVPTLQQELIRQGAVVRTSKEAE